MIISKQGNQLVLVRQDEHCPQAGDTARKWGNEQFEKLKYHDSVCLGIAKHDIGWKRPDDEVQYNEITKRPLNFLDVKLPEHVEFYEDGYRQALAEDPYAGLMLGLHWIGLYTSRYGYDPTFTYNVSEDLVDYMNSVIIKIEKEFVEFKHQYWNYKQKRSEFEDHVWMQYEFFQVMDRMSLFMALNNPMEEKEVYLGPVRTSREKPGINLHLKAPGNGKLIVDPFPFPEAFDTYHLARKVDDRDYQNHEEVREVVENTKKVHVEWKVAAK